MARSGRRAVRSGSYNATMRMWPYDSQADGIAELLRKRREMRERGVDIAPMRQSPEMLSMALSWSQSQHRGA